MPLSLTRRLAAELVGTFGFVFVGAGSAVGTQALGITDPGSALVIAALANGLGLAVAISATMGISGGAINPAVALALFFAKKLPGRDVVPYMLAEVAGAVLAALVLVATLPSALGKAVNWGSPSLGQGVGVWQGILLELVMTAFLLVAVFGTAVSPRAPKIGGFGIGIAVLTDVLVGGPFTGAAMNPARAIGPMLAGSFFPSYWYIYWVGPLVASLIIGGLYRFSPDNRPEP